MFIYLNATYLKSFNYSRSICSATPVEVEHPTAADVLQMNDITMVPGEVYPEQGLRLINIQIPELHLSSRELCCGTHVTNTKEISSFCIVNLKQTNRARFAFTAVAGQAAENVSYNRYKIIKALSW